MLHSQGTLFQINLLSLAGNHGKEAKAMAEYLIDRDMVDFVGTDMHNHRHCAKLEASIGSKDYRKHAEKVKDRIFNDSVL